MASTATIRLTGPDSPHMQEGKLASALREIGMPFEWIEVKTDAVESAGVHQATKLEALRRQADQADTLDRAGDEEREAEMAASFQDARRR